MKVAVCGKGGVGKSTIAVLLCSALLEKGFGVLAIDADPSPHLARLFGFSDRDITPIAEMKELLAERSQKQGPFYSLNPYIEDLPERYMLKKDGLKLMVLGAIREGGGGCACPEQTVLRRLLSFLVLRAEEAVVVDMEAGVEHFGRSTVVPMDAILVVTTPYAGSLETTERIMKLSRDLNLKNVWVVGNLVKDEEDEEMIRSALGVEPVVYFPYDEEVERREKKGKELLSLRGRAFDAAKALVEVLLGHFDH